MNKKVKIMQEYNNYTEPHMKLYAFRINFDCGVID